MDNLPVVSSVNDVKGIRQLFEKIGIHIRGLQALGLMSQQYGILFVPVLLSKVPQELRLIIRREFDVINWRLDELLKVFKTEVEARERCNSMAMTPTTTPRGNTHLSPLHQPSIHCWPQREREFHVPFVNRTTWHGWMCRTGSRTRFTRQMQIIKQTNVKSSRTPTE